jgi:hypothetical protein
MARLDEAVTDGAVFRPVSHEAGCIAIRGCVPHHARSFLLLARIMDWISRRSKNHGQSSSAALAAARSWWYTGGVEFDAAEESHILGSTGESSASGDLFG